MFLTLLLLLHQQLSSFMAHPIYPQPVLWELSGGQVYLYNHSSYQSSSAHRGLVHASHHFQSIVPSSLLSYCSFQLPLRCAEGHHSSTGPCLEKTLPLHITPSASVSHTALLSCSSPSAFPASPPSAHLLPASDNWVVSESSRRPVGLKFVLSNLKSSTFNPGWFLQGETKKRPKT